MTYATVNKTLRIEGRSAKIVSRNVNPSPTANNDARTGRQNYLGDADSADPERHTNRRTHSTVLAAADGVALDLTIFIWKYGSPD